MTANREFFKVGLIGARGKKFLILKIINKIFWVGPFF